MKKTVDEIRKRAEEGYSSLDDAAEDIQTLILLLYPPPESSHWRGRPVGKLGLRAIKAAGCKTWEDIYRADTSEFTQVKGVGGGTVRRLQADAEWALEDEIEKELKAKGCEVNLHHHYLSTNPHTKAVAVSHPEWRICVVHYKGDWYARQLADDKKLGPFRKMLEALLAFRNQFE